MRERERVDVEADMHDGTDHWRKYISHCSPKKSMTTSSLIRLSLSMASTVFKSMSYRATPSDVSTRKETFVPAFEVIERLKITSPTEGHVCRETWSHTEGFFI